MAAMVDRDLLRYHDVHAAGDTPSALFAIRPVDLGRVAVGPSPA
jgi:hypothetical protein